MATSTISNAGRSVLLNDFDAKDIKSTLVISKK